MQQIFAYFLYRKKMKIFKTLVVVIFLSPITAGADTDLDARELFSQWQPKSIHLAPDGTLRVVLPQRRITDTIYYAAIQGGFCLGPILGKSMTDVRSVFILNQTETQGWLFESGTAACETINSTPTNKAKILVAGQSSTHTNSANGL
jgi:hypothetical protein